ncbi:MAG: major facilitator superfamily protein [Thermoleophilia bacterium]|nr:major facilitator superfamily protein [Thermoleophilia bacterium]
MLPASLQIPAFRRLLAASTLSIVGSLMTFVVLPVVVWRETGSSTTFAFVLSGGALGMLVALPFGGVIADRFDRRRVMLCGDATSALVMGCTFAAVELRLWWTLPAISLVQTFLGSLFVSAGPALRRDVLAEDARTEGNALFMAGMSTANLVGPLLGGALYATAGFGAVVAVDLATFVASFLLVLGVRVPPGLGVAARPERGESGLRNAMRQTRVDIAAGIDVARRDPYLRCEVAACLAGGAANGLMLVAVVPWLDDVLGLSPSLWGIAISVMGGAGVAGSLAVARLGERVSTERLMSLGAVCFGAGALCFLGTPSVARIMVAFTLIGLTNTAINVAAGTATQRRVAASHQGRIGSLTTCAHQATQLVATLLAGLLLERVGVSAAMTASVVGFVVAATMHWRAARALRIAPTTFTEAQLALSA